MRRAVEEVERQRNRAAAIRRLSGRREKRPAANDVIVPERDRVEAAGVDSVPGIKRWR